MTMLTGMWYLLSCFAYLKLRDSTGIRDQVTWMLTACVSLALAMLSKQTAASIPVVWVLIEWLFFSKKRKRWILGLATVFIVVTGWLVIDNFTSIRTYDTLEFSRMDYLLNQTHVILRYIGLLFWPVGLNIDHHIQLLEWNSAVIIGSILAHLSLLVVAVLGIRKGNHVPAFLLGWLYLTLSVESSILPIRDLMFEHRMYLGVMSGGMIFALFVLYLTKRRPSVAPGFAIAVLMVLSFMTFKRNRVWKDELTLWKDAVAKAPEKYRTNYLYGSLLHKEKGEVDQAVRYFQRALRDDPNYSFAHNDLGAIYLQRKEYAKAVEHLKVAVIYDADNAIAFKNLGLAQLYLNAMPEAVACFEKALELDKRPENWFNLGYAYQRNGEIKKAIRQYERTIEKQPSFLNAYLYLGIAKNQLGAFEKAMEYLSNYLEAKPNDPTASQQMNYARARLKAGQ
jgi:Tfp pilus assembly protein PilF